MTRGGYCDVCAGICLHGYHLHEDPARSPKERTLYFELDDLDWKFPNPTRAVQLPSPAQWDRLNPSERAAFATIIRIDSDVIRSHIALAAGNAAKLVDEWERSG